MSDRDTIASSARWSAALASQELRRLARVTITAAALRVVLLCNPRKDELLSMFLHRLADGYSLRPSAAWERATEHAKA